MTAAAFGGAMEDGGVRVEWAGDGVRVSASDVAHLATDGFRKTAYIKQIPVSAVLPEWDPSIHDLLIHLHDLRVVAATPEFYMGLGFASTGPGTEIGRGIYWNPSAFKVGCCRHSSTYESSKSTQVAAPSQIWGLHRLSPATVGCTTQALVDGVWMGGETDIGMQTGLAAGGELFLCVGHEAVDSGPSDVHFRVTCDLVPKLHSVEPRF